MLALCSAGAGVFVSELRADQRDEPLASPPVGLQQPAFTSDAFSPVDPAITHQVLIEAKQAPAGDAIPDAISIPSPTAGFAGLALLGILLTRRRSTRADTRAM